LLISSLGMDVIIEQETDDVAALSVQGPTSCSVLMEAGFTGLDALKPFHILHTHLGGHGVMISRTGFTGDLGYELWTDPTNALPLWDAIFDVKKRGRYDVRAIGLDALDMARIDAGFVMPGNDFNTAETAIRAGHDRSPFELNLGWAVHLDKPAFTGKRALEQESAKPIKRRLMKLVVNGNKEPKDAFLFNAKKGRPIGTIKSHTWSPILKANLALADVEYKNGVPPKEIWAEVYYQKELEWRATWAPCKISNGPFWTHERRSVTPPPRC